MTDESSAEVIPQPEQEVEVGSDEEQAPSLAETLGAAYDEQMAATEVPEEGSEEESTEVDEEHEEPEGLSAPEHWSADHRQTFSELSALGEEGIAAQQFLLDRHKEMEGTATERFQEAAAARRMADAVREMVEPVRDAWAMRGLSEAQGLQMMVSYAQALERDPASLIRQVAQQYGVDLGQPETDEFVDPQAAQFQERINNLEQRLTDQQQEEQRAAVSQIETEISTFRDAKDADGNSLHPHFEAVLEDMQMIAAGMRASGQRPSLEDLYSKAVRMNPELSKAAEEAAQQERERQEREEKARKAKAARSASTRPRSSAASGGSTAPAGSLREELERQYDKQTRSQ